MEICAKGICKSYQKKSVLEDIHLSLAKGQVLGLFGPNGSGKSTLLEIMALVLEPSQGEYFIRDQDAFDNSKEQRKRIGYVPQDIALFEELSVYDNLMCWNHSKGKEAKQRVEEMIEQFSLSKFSKKKIVHLSGGMKRRVNIAVTVQNDYDILLLDEPFAGMDAENITMLIQHLERYKKQGKTIVICDHSPFLFSELLDWILILKNGKEIFWGNNDQLLMHAENEHQAIRTLIETSDC